MQTGYTMFKRGLIKTGESIALIIDLNIPKELKNAAQKSCKLQNKQK